MGAFLCGAGTKGRRYALPNARLLMQKTGFEEQVRMCLIRIKRRSEGRPAHCHAFN